MWATCGDNFANGLLLFPGQMAVILSLNDAVLAFKPCCHISAHVQKCALGKPILRLNDV